jgi:hypothetical protein
VAYLGGQAIDDIVAGGHRFPALPPGQPAPLREVLLASARATDQKGLYRFREAVDQLLYAAVDHQILYAIVVIAAAQTRRAQDPYVTIILPGGNLKTAVAKLDPAAVPFPDAKGLAFNYEPSAVFAVDERDSTSGADDQLLGFAANLMHEFTHVALARVYGNDSKPWYPGDERNAAEARPGAHQRVTDLMKRFELTPDKLAHPTFVEQAGKWLMVRFDQILDDWHSQTRGSGGKLSSESVPYLIEGTFLSVRYMDWTLFFNSTPISMGDYQRLVWPDLLAGETTARGENTVTAQPYPGLQRMF